MVGLCHWVHDLWTSKYDTLQYVYSCLGCLMEHPTTIGGLTKKLSIALLQVGEFNLSRNMDGGTVEHSTRSEALTNKNWGVFIERIDKILNLLGFAESMLS